MYGACGRHGSRWAGAGLGSAQLLDADAIGDHVAYPRNAGERCIGGNDVSRADPDCAGNEHSVERSQRRAREMREDLIDLMNNTLA